MNTPEVMTAEIIDALSQLDDTEQLIFILGARALSDKRFTIDQFTAWTQALVDRHRAGEELFLSDLETEVAA